VRRPFCHRLGPGETSGNDPAQRSTGFRPEGSL